ncbi:MAG: gliding motility-associated C-terminal domain-containing protein [Bacteroidia bacterium]|nr:gliding motility-associated C-terminal domain-containing protein [Bacteroidia bacterium]
MKKTIKNSLKTIRLVTLGFISMLGTVITTHAQSPCMPTVPSFTINLTGNPDSVWYSPNVSRNDQCCTATSPDQCVYFNLTLDPNVAGIQIDMVGADPAGSLFYDIGCAGAYPGGTVKCISGVGPHQITFCKPGKNKNVYIITSVSKPMFPKDDTVRIGCRKKLNSYGILKGTAVWAAISGTSAAQNAYFNTFLDSVNIASPTYSPAANAPAYIDYRVCGYPTASACGFSLTVCDTVRIYNFPTLTGTVTPNPATFCNIGPGSGVTLTGLASGGLAPYSYAWINTSSVVVGTGTSYFANTAGSYQLRINDALSNPGTCPAYFAPVSVSQGTLPIVNAGPSQKVCANTPTATLTGTVQYASGGVWSGGTGSFNPGNTFLNTNYTASPAEIAAGFVKLYLTSSGSGGGCSNTKDSTIIYFSPSMTVGINSGTLACYNSTTTLNATFSGGTAPYTYLWSTGAVTSSITGGQGNYGVTVTDSVGCSATTIPYINVIAPPALALTFNVSNVTVNGGNNGSATVNVTGGTPVYSVTWTPGGANTFSIGGLTYGIYTATIKDANGCDISGSTVVNEPRCLAFTANATSTNVLCYGDANGIATVTVSGGVPAYTYTWNSSPQQTTQTATGLPAGVYSVLIKDSNVPACFQTANVVISEPAQLLNVMTHTNVSTVGGNNGAAASNPFNGTTPYTYLWSTAATTSLITNLTAGSYSVNITDKNGCTKADSVRITQPPCNGLTLNVLTNNILCYGGNNGSALAVVGGASGSYTVNWSTGATGLSISGLSAGNYSVTVTTKECYENFNFTITQPPLLSVGLLPTNVSCAGAGDGSINLTVSGGTFPYNFVWNTGLGSEDLTWLSPGTYSVQITDANGCTAIASAVITEPNTLTITAVTSSSFSCVNGTNGSASINVSGGTAPYTYTWSTGATTSTISNLAGGGYTVVVKDANNCIATPSVVVIGIQSPDSVKVGTFSVSCSVPGSGLTQVYTTPTGGVGSYSVSYNGGSYIAAGTPTLLANGTTYTVLAKDLNGCISPLSQTLSILNEVKIDSVRFAKCYTVGTTSTVVTAYPSGGASGSYSVSFNNGTSYLAAGTYTSNLAVGASYTVVVKDSRGCISGSQVITLPTVLNGTATVTSNYNGQNISCFGLTDGSALATASGGTGAYTYTWSTSPVQNTAAASNLGAATYSVIIKDGNSCSITRTVTLTQPVAVTATAVATSNYNGQNISCFGFSNGTASVSASGGTSPFTYAWNSIPTQTTASASGLSAGTYSVVVKDANNCSVTKTVTLTQPASITSTVSVTSNFNGQQVSCFGATNGSITALASNGTAPFTYTWSTSPVQTGTIATNVGAGTYSVIIIDVNGCNVTRTVSVSQPPAIAATTSITSNFNGQNVSCFGSTNGSASVTTSGGTTPYTYTWTTTPAQTTASATNLGAGVYSVTVTDVNGCATVKTVTLTQPTAVASTMSITSNYNGQNISCFGLSDGSALATVTGGTGVYSYTWTTVPVQNTAAASNLSAGTYTVTIKDINNCTITNTVTLTQPTAVTSTAVVTSNYNGQNISCNGYSDGTATVTANGGTSPYTYQWNSIPTQTTALATGLSAGTYSVVVKDVNNCSITTTVNLTQPAAITSTLAVISNYNGQNVTCFGATNGSITAVASNGTAPFTYTWSTTPVQTGTIATGVGAGTYSVIITDANGCNYTRTISVSQPPAIAATTSITSNYNGQNVSCFGSTNGSASVTTTGGTSPFTYSWTTVPSQTTAAANNIGAGTYSVTVTDVNGCNITSTVTLTQPTVVNAQIFDLSNYAGYNISCFGASNGYIDITVNGGTGAYTYTWSNAATTQDLNGLTAGNYSVVVTDINGCKDTLNVPLTEPTQLVVTIDSLSNYNGYNISCYGGNNGFAYVSVIGGVTNYTYTWSNTSTNQNLSNVTAGTYSLLVTDQNRCNATIDTTLTQPPAITFSAAVTSPLCNGVPTGSINATLGGGVTPFTYTWSTTATTEDLINIGAGTYTLVYSDNNGCKDTVSVSVTQPDSIKIDDRVDNLKCNGDTIGNIFINPVGGTAPYTYSWSTGDTTQNLLNINSGTYVLVITDANGCTFTDTTKITEPDSLKLTLTSPIQFSGYNISGYNGNDGSINLNVTGGTTPYTYLWSNGSTSQNPSNLTAGNYFVTVTDTNGCRISGDITLTQPLILEMPQGFSPNNDGKNDFFVVHGIEAYPDNKLTIYNRWGNIVYSKEGYLNEWDGQSNNGQELPNATYFAILEVNKGEIVLKGFVELRK